ncbi:MAG: S9 family peptidase [Rudaea sp.]|uniref:S9 family peptidase n=1 Tax=unclassified Rudaea TaxID=2627037 RepID=UPI0010FA5194|nr:MULTISPECIES: S9 family peptidase [unclassified Rudaea]MBN8886208.1 S9 family peptidase [Rudaea sp.]MBR0345572.1 S9 family peptidase [Rudaea sp.]
MMRAALFVPIFFLLMATANAAPIRKTVEPADLVNLKGVSGAQISPDGASVVYVVDAGDSSSLWVVTTDRKSPARTIAAGDGSETSPRWSPDGQTIAFLSSRANPHAADARFRFSVANADDRIDFHAKSGGDKDSMESDAKPGRQIWIVAATGGEATPLTNISGNVRNFKWSRDGRFLAFTRKDQETRAEVRSREQKQDQVVVDRVLKYSRLWIYDLSTREARLLTKGDTNVVDYDWSPDGTHIAATVSATPRTDDVENRLSVMTFSTESGKVDRTLPGYASERMIRWSPDGRALAFIQLAPTTDTGIPVLFDLKSGSKIVVGAGIPMGVGDMVWNEDGKTLTSLVLRGATYSLARIDAASGAVTDLGILEGAADKVTVSRDSRKAAFVEETPQHPGEVHVFSGSVARPLTDTNPQVASWNLGTQQALSWKSSKDGRSIHGVLLLPPNYDRTKRYKTIVHLHGGPVGAWTLGFHASWYNWGLVAASHGYVVLLPNPRGSSGQGPDFSAANDRDWGNAEFQDILDGVDLLITRNIADPDRLAIGGWSYGGFLTAWVVTHTDRFKAAVAGAAMTDLFGMATTTDIAPSFLDRYFGPLVSNRALYDAHSPARFLENCRTPTLVLDGEEDARVPISQGEALFNGLRFIGRETQMVRYPREGHFFDEKPHQQDSLERMLAWYDRHLGE